MSAINLPNDIFGKDEENSSIQIFDITSKPEILRSQSILLKNSISLPVSGEKQIYFSTHKMTINAENIYFLSSVNSISSINIHKPFRTILLFFDDKDIVNILSKINSKIHNRRSMMKASSFLAFSKDEFLKNYTNSLIILLNRQHLSGNMADLKFKELIIYISQAYPEKLNSFQSNYDKCKEDNNMHSIVNSHVNSPITVGELAFLCNMSISSFKRRFTKLYGIPPNKYISNRRMENAKDLLKNYHAKPSEVYHTVGFQNHSSFSKHFKKAFGLTPTAFQAKNLVH